VALQPRQRVAGVIVQFAQRSPTLLLLLRRRIEQQGQRLFVSSLLVQQAALDVGRQRQCRIGFAGEPGLSACRVGIVAGERDAREQLVGRGAGGGVVLCQVGGDLRLLARVVELSLFQECRR